MNNVPNDFNNQNANEYNQIPNGYNFDPNQQVKQMNFNPEVNNYAPNGYQAPEPVTPKEELRVEPSKKIHLIYLIIILILMIAFAFVLLKKKNYYAVVFVNKDNVEAIVVKENDTASSKVISDETFLGWYVGDTKFDFSSKITSNTILTAKYQEETKEYTVTFDTDGATPIDPVTIKENEVVAKPATDPKKDEYRFVEWQLNGVAYDFTQKVTSDITLVAKYEALDPSEITYTVTFDTNGANTIEPVVVKKDAKVKKPTNPTKEGATFIEWQLDGKKYDFNQKVTKSITLIASYKEKTKVKVTFNTDGGTAVPEAELYAGDALGTLPTTTKANYTFSGWYNGTTKYTEKSKITSSITLKAKWLTADEVTLEKAKKSIKSSYNITKGNQEISVSYTGCTIKNTNTDLKEITRNTTDAKISLNFDIQCGSAKATVKSTGIIQKSTYTFSLAEKKLTIDNGSSLNGKLYKEDGSLLGTLTNGSLDLEEDLTITSIKMVLDSDAATTYVVSKKA